MLGLSSVAVIADGFHGAAFHGFLAARFFLRRAGLLVNVRITTVIAAGEIVRRGFAAQVAVDALIIDEKFAGHVVSVSICNVSHKIE